MLHATHLPARFLRQSFGNGLRFAPQVGTVDPMAGVTKDATSGIYAPATLSEWNTTMSAAGLATGAPSAVWPLQEASGNPADVLGAYPLTATSLTYQTAVSGWSRKAVSWTASSTSKAATSIPNTSSSSVLLLLYFYMGATPGGTRALGGFGGGTGATIEVLTTGNLRCADGANTADGATAMTANVVQPTVLRYNNTAGNTTLYTDKEKITPLYAALSGTTVAIGSANSVTTVAGGCLYGVMFLGAAAELSDAQVKSLIQTLGWTVTGY